MAKRKTAKRKVVRSRSRVARKVVRSRRKSSSSNSNKQIMATVTGGFMYGAGRQTVSDGLQTLANKTGIPIVKVLGRYSDEALMGVFSYYLAKGKVPVLSKFNPKLMKNIGMTGLALESARLGGDIVAPMIGKLGMPTTQKATGTNSFR